MAAWLVLILRFPVHPSSLRVKAWRRLRAIGAVALMRQDRHPVRTVTAVKGAEVETGSGEAGPRSARMQDLMMPRRGLLKTIVAALGTWGVMRRAPLVAAPAELNVPENVPAERFDFETKALEGWTTVNGQWALEEMAGAPSGTHVLLQRATTNQFNVIVAPPGPYTDVDVAMKFKPISGREDASGGIVFRFTDGKYYVVRANALEDNFRLYYYDRGRRQLATARVKAPALGQWHAVRVVTVGDHIQAWLNGTLLLDHRDARFKAGRVGLWTKADSVTAFNDLVVRGVSGGG